MGTQDSSQSKDSEIKFLEKALEMKEKGANNTQIRAFLEEHGMSQIVFEEDDAGKNPGLLPES
jgi:hypothetical protein